MTQFIRYWKLVARRATALWWEFVWSNFLLAAILAAAAFVLGALATSDRDTIIGAIRQWQEAPMDSLVEMAWGGVGILALIGLSCLAFLFLVAPSQIHSEQLEALNQSRGELETARRETEGRKPRLSGEVKTKLILSLHNELTNNRSLMLALYVLVRNTGEPSIAENWLLTIKPPNHSPIILKPLTLDDESAAHFAGMLPQKGLRPFARERNIMRVTNQPISKGAAASGWFLAMIDAISYEEFDDKASEFILEFTDINNTKHICAVVAGEDMPDDLQIQMQGDL